MVISTMDTKEFYLFYAETKADWARSPFRPSLIDWTINQPSHAAVTFWQTASLLHLSTAYAGNGFHQIEHSSVRAGPAHQDNARSYHPRRVSHTAPQTSKAISYLSHV